MEDQEQRPNVQRFEFRKETEPGIKPCPFCAEPIQAKAVKCRFCNEFLNTPKAKALEAEQNSEETVEGASQGVLFAGRPSLLGLWTTFVKGGIVFAIGVLLMAYPFEKHISSIINGDSGALAGYRQVFGAGIVIIVVLVFCWKVMRLRMMHYEVTPDRIEFTRGILDRKVDNLDMFRVQDLKLRRSMVDIVLGIGKVVLITNDKSDPEFKFEKVRHSRKLYDAIKIASLDADGKRGVVHLE